MRSTWALVLLQPLLTAAKPLSEARVYFFEPSSTTITSKDLKLDAESAKLVFSRRLGLSQFHELGDVSEETITTLNQLGGRPQTLLGLSEAKKENGFVVVEGVQDASDILDCTGSSWSDFAITNIPSEEDNDDLISAFVRQTSVIGGSFSSDKVWQSFQAFGDAFKHDAKTRGSSLYAHVKSLMASENRNAAVKELKQQIAGLVDSARSNKTPLTIVMMPPSPASSTHRKRSTNVYGVLETRQRAQEPEGITVKPIHKIPADSTTGEQGAHSFANDTKPLRGILPACFDSQEDCESTTRSCTGHGKCKLKYKINTGSGDKSCYACACKAEIKDVKGGGKKTTNWGGPACQKKDVVMPFWLLAGFTVIIMSVLTWAIGLLYSMGNEDLPSVIGAGVSGPRAK